MVDKRRETAALWQLYDTVAQRQARAQTSIATGATAALVAAGQAADVDVVWDDPFPDDTYRTRVVLLGLLGRGSAAVVAQTRTGATVRVTATLAVLAGTQFLVLGTA